MVIGLDYNILTQANIVFILLVCGTIAAVQDDEGFTDTSTIISTKWTLDNEFSQNDRAVVRILRQSGKAKAYSLGQQDLGDQIKINVTAFNRTFTLELTANTHLIHPSYVEKTIDEFGTTEYQGNANTTIKDCYYVGVVANQSNSAAAASTCSGLSAQILLGDELYHIEPVDDTLTGRHRAFRQSDSQLPAYTCGNANGAPTPPQFRRREKRATLNWPQDLSGVTRVVEYYIVNDFSQYTAQGRNIDTVNSRAKTIVNFASLLYQPIDVYITIVGIETWTGASLITINASDSSQTLDNFLSYRSTRITQRNDNAQLLTSFGYSGGIVGLAYLNGMCDPRLSVALVCDVSATPGYTSAIIAHEMGHNFGMRHDDQIFGGCSCVSENGYCIMNYFVTNPPATQWSQCSKSTMTSFLASISSYCLNDFNNVLFDATSVCGNGIVEGDEQCDCGRAPITMKPITTVCRSAAGACDLAEYCSGVNNTCPSDIYQHDGTDCTVARESSYCYNGLCRTQTTQCQLWWGQTTVSSSDLCYSRFNVRGDDAGNCAAKRPGATGVSVSCPLSDVKCGSLMCNIFVTDISQQLVLKYPNPIGSGEYIVYSYEIPNFLGQRIYNCTVGYSTNGDPAWVDPGYVPNGAVCDNNKMCVNRKCVNTSSIINTVPCPFCNNQGICNSLGQCHCNRGYAPPDCSLPGNGGSYHSNPIAILNQPTTFITQTSTAVLTTMPGSTVPPTTTQLPTTTSTTTSAPGPNGTNTDPSSSSRLSTSTASSTAAITQPLTTAFSYVSSTILSGTSLNTKPASTPSLTTLGVTATTTQLPTTTSTTTSAPGTSGTNADPSSSSRLSTSTASSTAAITQPLTTAFSSVSSTILSGTSLNTKPVSTPSLTTLGVTATTTQLPTTTSTTTSAPGTNGTNADPSSSSRLSTSTASSTAAITQPLTTAFSSASSTILSGTSLNTKPASTPSLTTLGITATTTQLPTTTSTTTSAPGTSGTNDDPSSSSRLSTSTASSTAAITQPLTTAFSSASSTILSGTSLNTKPASTPSLTTLGGTATTTQLPTTTSTTTSAPGTNGTNADPSSSSRLSTSTASSTAAITQPLTTAFSSASSTILSGTSLNTKPASTPSLTTLGVTATTTQLPTTTSIPKTTTSRERSLSSSSSSDVSVTTSGGTSVPTQPPSTASMRTSGTATSETSASTGSKSGSSVTKLLSVTTPTQTTPTTTSSASSTTMSRMSVEVSSVFRLSATTPESTETPGISSQPSSLAPLTSSETSVDDTNNSSGLSTTAIAALVGSIGGVALTAVIALVAGYLRPPPVPVPPPSTGTPFTVGTKPPPFRAEWISARNSSFGQPNYGYHSAFNNV